MAHTLRGQSIFPSERAMTSLVGQAIRIIDERHFFNVDVIFKVVGLSTEQVMARAITVQLEATSVKVMHPFQVLYSRIANLHELQEKQNDKGSAQAALAVLAARAFLREQAASAQPQDVATGRSPIQKWVSEIEHFACEDAARKVARRWGVHAANAIDPLLIPAGLFWEKRWPGLRELMSPEYVEAIEASPEFGDRVRTSITSTRIVGENSSGDVES